MPALLFAVSVVLFFGCLQRASRNDGFTPMDPDLHARVIDYRDDPPMLRARLYHGERAHGIVPARDDRPWRSYVEGDRVRLLMRAGYDARGRPETQYAVDDFRSMWGGLTACAALAILCDVAAIAAILLARRRPSAARRFPPPLPPSARSVS